MKKTYECMLLLDNREVKKGWSQTKQAVGALFEKHGAEVLSARLWSERRLAYPIKSQRRGTYLLVYLSSSPESISAIRRELEFDEAVLRQMLQSCDEIPAEAFEPEREFDVSALGETPRREEPATSARTEEKAKDSKPAEPEATTKQADAETAAEQPAGVGSQDPAEKDDSDTKADEQ